MSAVVNSSLSKADLIAKLCRIVEGAESGANLRQLCGIAWTSLSTQQRGALHRLCQHQAELYDPYQSVLLTNLFGFQLAHYEFCVVSTNVHLNSSNPQISYPAEIGISRFSLVGGVRTIFGGMTASDPIPSMDYDLVGEHYAKHGIPTVGARWDPPIPWGPLVKVVNECLHPSTWEPEHQFTPKVVVIEDSEFDQTKAVLETIKSKAKEVKIDLTWNLVLVPLSSLWHYCMYSMDSIKCKYDYLPHLIADLTLFEAGCRHHRREFPSKNCARYKAFQYAATVSRVFTCKRWH